MNLPTYTHKASKWTRTLLSGQAGTWTITPTDDSGVRTVRFISRYGWANDPNDSKANQDVDRVVLIDGAPLPDWAATWLDKAHRKSCEDARARLQDAIDDADNAPFRNEGW